MLFLLGACAALIAVNLRTYQRLSFEQPAGELQFTRTGPRQFNAVLTYPDGERAIFSLRGDEWQVDARVLKWQAFANLVGFDTAYRLERISGRYARIEDERTLPRTVYDLNPPQRIDPWDLVHRYHSWLPWVDALYGSATFLPMADGALYEIKVSQSGLRGASAQSSRARRGRQLALAMARRIARRIARLALICARPDRVGHAIAVGLAQAARE